MNFTKLLKVMHKVSAAGVDLSFIDGLLTDQKVGVLLERYSALKELIIDPEDTESIARLLSIFNINVPEDRLLSFKRALEEEGVNESALDFLMSGKAFKILLFRNGEGEMQGEWERDEQGELQFVPQSVLTQ